MCAPITGVISYIDNIDQHRENRNAILVDDILGQITGTICGNLNGQTRYLFWIR
jgi:hypothetical protein